MALILIMSLALPMAARSFVVDLKPRQMVLRVGDTQHLSCSAKDCTESATFMWTSFEDKPLSGTIQNPSALESLLVFDPVSTAHENLVVCKVSCGHELKQQHSTVKVYSFAKDPVIRGNDPMLMGEVNTLTCEVPEVYPPEYLEVEWVQGDSVLHTDEGKADKSTVLSRYEYTPTPEDNGKAITCRARHTFEGLPEDKNTKETTVLMNVRSPPRNTSITVSPAGEHKEGESVTISCHTDSVPVGRLVLRRVSGDQTVDLQSSPSSSTSVTLPSIQLGAIMSITVFITMMLCFAHSPGAHPLEVELNPGVGVITVERGMSFVLSCRALDCPKPVFFWKSPLDATIRSRSKTKGNLTELYLSPVELKDEKAYTCEVKCGSVVKSKRTELKVFSFPLDPVIESSGAHIVGEASTLRCDVRDVFPAERMQIEWLDEEERVLLLEEGSLFSGLQNLTSELTFTPGWAHQGRQITCRASLQVEGLPRNQTVRAAVTTVALSYGPRNTSITVSPAGEHKEGESVTISCHTDSVPVGRLVLRRVSGDQTVDLQSSPSSSTSVTLPSIQLSDSGLYRCEALNEHGNETTSTQVIVKAPPRNMTVQVLPSSEVLEGQNVTICCKWVSYPPPAVILKKPGNGTELYSPNGTFLLVNLMPSDTGLYQVNVTNDLGFETEVFVISVMEKQSSPPPNSNDFIFPAIAVGALVTMATMAGLVAYNLNQARKRGSYELTKTTPQTA
ncbi:hypothetical protein JZ751_024722 [Albula glossodonta]|uniref:Ig-like domain-containing protein n=1 Tax=Albula glossodonta TaxID=121402 RepID=A0A8T2PBS3_9TELE|nr:hypothetical protein JZ751_024722 [Albula glossodonta]